MTKVSSYPTGELITVKPLLSYFPLSYGGAAGWLIVSRGRDSWLILTGSSYILHVSALSKLREVSLYSTSLFFRNPQSKL